MNSPRLPLRFQLHDALQQVRGLSADLGAVQPERMQFDVCSVDDDADSAVLFLCDVRDRVALAFCMNGSGHMGIEDNLIDHNQVTRDCCAQQLESHAHIYLPSNLWFPMHPASGSVCVSTFTGVPSPCITPPCTHTVWFLRLIEARAGPARRSISSSTVR